MAQALIELKLPTSSIANKQRTATMQAKNLLEANQAAYQALVAALEARASVGECYAAIGQATGGVMIVPAAPNHTGVFNPLKNLGKTQLFIIRR
jgi:hypothetical protein